MANEPPVLRTIAPSENFTIKKNILRHAISQRRQKGNARGRCAIREYRRSEEMCLSDRGRRARCNAARASRGVQ
ncbi:hypothetical protein EVAR_40548_1 [Eumeta japonica]|uniref:Uncharacterized protein n=1 Tax=Eumeta variegata TaxID=151549 RepID=A0A4C1VVB7_EUMVA|nr:hypothetical protein EVAR_40548_1 [Eumeta japonica]